MALPCASPESRTAVLAARLSDERERGEVVEEVKVKKCEEKWMTTKFDDRCRRDAMSILIASPSLSFALRLETHKQQSLLQSDDFSEAVIHLRALASCVSDCESAVS